MIVSFELLGYCLLAGGIFLILFNLLWNRLENHLPVLTGFPYDLVETKTAGWFISCFTVEFIFLVFLPALVYGWFYTVIPFSGARGGIVTALFVFLIGITPYALLILFRLKIPVVYILYQLLGIFIKLVGSLIIIGYLYSL